MGELVSSRLTTCAANKDALETEPDTGKEADRNALQNESIISLVVLWGDVTFFPCTLVTVFNQISVVANVVKNNLVLEDDNSNSEKCF